MRFERTLLTAHGEHVTLYLEQVGSERANEGGCRIGLQGSGIGHSTVLYGIDSMQALLLAVRHLPSFVEKVSRNLELPGLVWDAGNDTQDLGLLPRPT